MHFYKQVNTLLVSLSTGDMFMYICIALYLRYVFSWLIYSTSESVQ